MVTHNMTVTPGSAAKQKRQCVHSLTEKKVVGADVPASVTTLAPEANQRITVALR